MSTLQDVLERLPSMAKDANRGCGQVYELYVQSYSAMVDSAMSSLSEADQAIVLKAAHEHGSYATVAEREDMNRMFEEQGLCCHGLDAQTCPCGCFEHDDYYEEADSEPDGMSYLEVIELRGLELQLWICKQFEPIYLEYRAGGSVRAEEALLDLHWEMERLECLGA